jgi:L-ascorbate metabolism protein UlaG (beta-lactamase superfamily)
MRDERRARNANHVSAMRISKYIHSCLLVEEGGTTILIDPGKFSFLEGGAKPEQFRGLDAIVLTHEHPDHMDDESLKTIVANNPGAPVIANSAIRERLGEKGIDVEVHESGSRTVGAISLRAIVATHANLLNATPPRNVGYVVNDRLLHPGDSFDEALDVCKGIDILALPVMAPWNTELQVAAFATRIAPKVAIPIHDGYAKEFFLKMRYENYRKYFAQQGIEFVGLNGVGAALER